MFETHPGLNGGPETSHSLDPKIVWNKNPVYINMRVERRNVTERKKKKTLEGNPNF